MPAAVSFLIHIPQPHSSNQMTVIQPLGVQWVVSLLQLKLGYSCDVFISDFNHKKQISWAYHIDELSESSITYDMIICNVSRSPWRVRYNHEIQ
jgi:hypothetical protein